MLHNPFHTNTLYLLYHLLKCSQVTKHPWVRRTTYLYQICWRSLLHSDKTNEINKKKMELYNLWLKWLKCPTQLDPREFPLSPLGFSNLMFSSTPIIINYCYPCLGHGDGSRHWKLPGHHIGHIEVEEPQTDGRWLSEALEMPPRPVCHSRKKNTRNTRFCETSSCPSLIPRTLFFKKIKKSDQYLKESDEEVHRWLNGTVKVHDLKNPILCWLGKNVSQPFHQHQHCSTKVRRHFTSKWGHM